MGGTLGDAVLFCVYIEKPDSNRASRSLGVEFSLSRRSREGRAGGSGVGGLGRRVGQSAVWRACLSLRAQHSL